MGLPLGVLSRPDKLRPGQQHPLLFRQGETHPVFPLGEGGVLGALLRKEGEHHLLGSVFVVVALEFQSHACSIASFR